MRSSRMAAWILVCVALGGLGPLGSACSSDGGATQDTTAAGDTVSDADAADSDEADTSGPVDTNEPGDTDGDADASDTLDIAGDADAADADTTTDPRVAVTFHLVDFVSAENLAGATLTAGTETAVTGADGRATLQLDADADVLVVATGTGFRDHYIYHHTASDDVTLAYQIATDSTIAAFEAILAITVDDARALLDVVVVDEATGASIPNMTIGIDVASDLSLVVDAASPTGLSLGDTTIAGSPSLAIFVNAAAGDITPSFVHPWGWSCDGPSPIGVPAGAYVIAEYRCSYTPVQQTYKLTDFVTAAAIVGANVSVLGQSLTTDDQGVVAFDAPQHEDIVLEVTGTGFRDHYIYRRTLDHAAVLVYALATDTTVAAMEAALGQTVDDSKGIISISPRTAAQQSIAGVTIDLDVAYELALAFDSNAGIGVSPGNTTLADSASTVIFVNATPGAVTPSFTDAAGTVCTVGPIPVDLPAGTYVIANYECAVPAE